MQADSLESLEAVFGDWRSSKRHVRERVPDELIARARRSATVHGVGAVVKATAIDGRRLVEEGISGAKKGDRPAKRNSDAERRATASPQQSSPGCHSSKRVSVGRAKTAASVPSYSRLAFHASETSTHPLAEVETLAGVKVKVFQITTEMIPLLSALSSVGRAS